MPNFPTSLDSLANPTPTTLRNDPGFSLAGQIAALNDIAEALEAKLGIGASTPGTAGVLRRTGTGASAWGQVVGGDIAAGAASTFLTTTSGGVVGFTPITTVAPGVQTLIAQVGPLVGTQASFDFTSIPQTFKHLRLVLQGRTNTNATTDSVSMRMNNVGSGSFYFDQALYATAAGVSSAETLSGNWNLIGMLAGNLAAGGAAGQLVVDIADYSLGGVFIKTWTSQNFGQWGTGATNMQLQIRGGSFFSSAAVTQLTILPASLGAFTAGTYVALYGY